MRIKTQLKRINMSKTGALYWV